MNQEEVKEKKLSSQFQNRLVGIIVLVALGVIFLPDILDGKKQHQEEQFAEIPLRPGLVGDLNEPEEIAAVDLSDAKAQFESQQPESQLQTEATKPAEQIKKKQLETSSSQQPAESKPQATTTKESAAYTLQLGSFKNAANVNALVKRLRKEGFRAYTLPQKPVDGELTKVFVGPDVSIAKLEKLQQQLDKSTGLKSAVVSYNPVE